MSQPRHPGNTFCCIPTVPNLRLLCTKRQHDEGSSVVPYGGLYRSSKPDRISHEDLHEFRKLGIKCIIDLRSVDEYLASDGLRLLDTQYVVHKVIPPRKAGGGPVFERLDEAHHRSSSSKYLSEVEKTGNSKRQDEASGDERADLVDKNSGPSSECSTEGERKHLFINFFTAKYIMKMFSKLPCYLYCVGIFHLICDLIRRDKSFKRFSTFFISNIVNKGGIQGQYIDVVEYCQPAICTALKLIADRENQPALLNCAHGKDRTGIVSALVLSCLGAPNDYIIAEYAMSEEGLKPVLHLVEKDMIEKYNMNQEFVTARASTMRNLLLYIEDKYGSVQNYMEMIGFSLAEQQALKASLATPTWPSGDISNPSGDAQADKS